MSTTTPPAKPIVATPVPVVQKETPTAVVKPVVTTPAKTADQSTEIERLKREVEVLKKKQSQQAAQTEKALPPPVPVINTPPPNTTLCNGTNWTRCPVGQDFVCPANGNAYCLIPQQPFKTSDSIPRTETWEDKEARDFLYADQRGWTSLTSTNASGEKRYYRKEGSQWVRKSSEYEAQQSYYADTNNTQLQKVVDFLESENAKKQAQQLTQDLAKTSEIKSLELQLVDLEEQAKKLNAELFGAKNQIDSQPIALSFISGQKVAEEKAVALKLQVNSIQQQAIIRKLALLEGIYLPPPIVTTPTSPSVQCFWSDGGTVWNCSSNSVGTQTGTYTRCFWSNGGTMWNCL